MLKPFMEGAAAATLLHLVRSEDVWILELPLDLEHSEDVTEDSEVMVLDSEDPENATVDSEALEVLESVTADSESSGSIQLVLKAQKVVVEDRRAQNNLVVDSEDSKAEAVMHSLGSLDSEVSLDSVDSEDVIIVDSPEPMDQRTSHQDSQKDVEELKKVREDVMDVEEDSEDSEYMED